jgi:hypothetical protein
LTLIIGITGILTGALKGFWCLLGGTSLFVAINLVWLLGFAAWEWHDLEENGCVRRRECYCEQQNPRTGRVSRGKVRQPGCTISAFAPVLSGLLILGEVDYRRRKRPSAQVRNPMQTTTAVSIGYGISVVLLGPGSMLFHASIKEVPGSFDPMSIVIFATFVFCYSLFRSFSCFTNDDMVFRVVLWSVWVVLAAGLIVMVVSGLTDVASAIAITLVLVWEVIRLSIHSFARTPPFGQRRNLGLGWFALLTFATTFVIWWLSQTNGPLCVDPSSPVLQGHNVWHLGAMGAAPYLIFRYFYSEGVR